MKLPHLTNAELAIMELLWDSEPLTARAIKERLYPAATKAQHGTVQRLLQRLDDKGFVHRDRSLGVQQFSPAFDRATFASNQLESLADRLSDGSLAPLITHLVEEKRISHEEIMRLRKILDEAQGEEES